MKSMTGYGVAAAPVGDGELVAEIRALNHRYLDIRTVASADLAPYAHEAEQVLRKAVARGRYELRLRTTGASPSALVVDVDTAKQVYGALRQLKADLGDATPLSVEAALSIVPEPLRAPRASDEVLAAIRGVVEAAVTDLDLMRCREGEALHAELSASLRAIRAHREAAREGCAGTVDAHRERLRERIDALVAGSDAVVDEGRIEAEIAILAERTDVTEELVRLGSHADQLEAVLDGADATVGRKLDFLLQELNREANTLAAKCQDAAVTHIAVEIKAEIERMRQQTANVM